MADGRGNVLSIRTDEGIVFELPLAGPMTRFLALGIDLCVTLAFNTILSAVLKLGMAVSPDVFEGLLMLLTVVFHFGYGMLMEWFFRGQTLGKRLLGIRVVDVQGLRLAFSQVLIRNLFRVVDILPGFYLVGGVAMLLNGRYQRLGDLAANTIVVRERSAFQPDLDQVLPGKYNSFREYPHLEARLRQRISPEQAATMLQALLRREELDLEARSELYAEMANHLREIVPFPEEVSAGLSDEQYLRNALESLMRRRGVQE